MTTYTNSFFNTKEDYLLFKKAWAFAVNHEGAKHYYREIDGQKYRFPGWIYSYHFVLYNLLRDKPVDRGFTKITKVNKLANGRAATAAVDAAVSGLKYTLKLIRSTGNRYTTKEQAEKERNQALTNLIQPLLAYCEEGTHHEFKTMMTEAINKIDIEKL